MNANRFDTYSRMLAVIDTRRGLTRLLIVVPLLGGLGAVLGEETEAGRRHRRRVRHKHRHNKHRRHRKHEPNNGQTQPPPATCSPPCPVCQTCTETGLCVPDPGQNRTVCAGTHPTTSVCCNGTCCNGCCDEAGVCGACLVFVTGAPPLDGKLGGLSGADSTCLQRAQAGLLPGASVEGNYKAWLSDSIASPATRFRRSGQPYLLPDVGNTKVADDWVDLASCDGSGQCLDHAIDVTETGAALGFNGRIWTHTLPDGTAAAGSDHCNEWQSNDLGDLGDFGQTLPVDELWTFGPKESCHDSDELYCFQQS